MTGETVHRGNVAATLLEGGSVAVSMTKPERSRGSRRAMLHGKREIAEFYARHVAAADSLETSRNVVAALNALAKREGGPSWLNQQ